MAKYYFFFPPETNLTHIQPVRAKNIHEAWEIMNFFFKDFLGYGFTITQLISEDQYYPEAMLPILTKQHIEEVLNERKQHQSI